MGNSLVTYVSGAGFRPLDFTTEYASYATAGATNNTRESITTDLTGLTGRSLNSLVIHNNSSAASVLNITGAGAGNGLVNTSGAFLFTLNPAAAASSSHSVTLGGFDDGISVGSSEYVFFVQNPSAATNTPTLTAMIGSALTSAADITKSGRGTLILNQVNTAGGGIRKTTINEGVLEIGDLDHIGGDTGNLVFAGGTMRLGTGFADDLSSRSISFLTGGGTLDTNGIDISLANSLGSGVGGFTKAGLGNLTLNAGATYTGNTVLALGTVTVGANNALGVGGNLTLAAGTTLALGANTVSHHLVTTSGASPAITGTGTINASGGFFFNHTGNTVIGATLAGAGGLLKGQTNVLTLNGVNSYSGVTEIRAGGLSIDSIANVAGGASALGSPATTADGVIRMGLTTAATSLTYTGSGHTSDRLIGMQGTTGGVTLNGSGAGAVGYGGAHFETPGNKTLTLGGSSDVALINSIGLLKEIGGVMTVLKTDANTWSMIQSNAYSGATSINNGVLRLDAEQNLTGALNFGSANNITTAGRLEVNESASFGSLVVQTNSAVNTNQLSIAAGKTLQINGNATIGSGVGALSNTLLTATGDGTLNITNLASAAQFRVGGSATAGNVTEADFSGLTEMVVSLNTTNGILRVNSTTGTNVNNTFSIFKLPGDTTVTAATLAVGDGGQYNGSAGQVNQLQLGAGETVFNVNTVNIGTGARDLGSVTFQDTNGTISIRAADGTAGAAFNMGTGTAVTAVALSGNQNTFDVTGHDADLKFSSVNIGTQNRNADLLNVFSFDTGTLEIGALTASTKGSNGNTTTTNINIGGGTVTTGAWTLATTTGNGNAVATANLTGGNITFSGSINRGTDAVGGGTATGTVNLNGATLDMGGNSIGSTINQIVFNAESGELQNLAELNGGGVLTKTTAGSLSLGNGNTYTGGTTVSAGSLFANNTTGSATGSGSVSVATGATLGGSGLVTPGVNNSVTIDSGATLTVGNLSDTQGSALTITTSGTGELTINGKVEFDIWSGVGDNSAAPLTADRLVIGGGNVLLGGTLAINNPNSIVSWAAGDVWRLFDWALATNVSGSFTNITSTVGNFNDLPDLSAIDPLLAWDASNLYSQGTLSVVVIPEPSRVLLVLIGLLGAVMRRRK
jgi:autotransporter-associated beta strand protein